MLFESRFVLVVNVYAKSRATTNNSYKRSITVKKGGKLII